jgi:hypothetical protein
VLALALATTQHKAPSRAQTAALSALCDTRNILAAFMTRLIHGMISAFPKRKHSTSKPRDQQGNQHAG